MKDKDEAFDMRMKMWKMRDELLGSMSDKELRAFIKGYMMGQRTVFKHMGSKRRCGSEGCQCSTCGGSCNDNCESK